MTIFIYILICFSFVFLSLASVRISPKYVDFGWLGLAFLVLTQVLRFPH